MGLFEKAQEDFNQITTDLTGFGQAFTITNPVGGQIVNLVGLSTKHHIAYDTEGLMINSKNATVTFTEVQLTDASYPVRNANQEVDVLGHIIKVKDSTSVIKDYVITEIYPDEYLGSIVCVLGDFETI